VPGVDGIEELVAIGLVRLDARGAYHPILAESVPTLENGQWRLLPDGRMETTSHVRASAQWHDGTPFTVDDLIFTVRVGRDKDLSAFANRALDLIDGFDTPDARTITVKWKEPFIQADELFSQRTALPLPRHLLESVFNDDKPGFLEHPYWTSQFVGTGPFRVKEFVAGSRLNLTPFDAFPLGRPKVDEVEVRFIQDPNTLIASILAGEVQLTLGRALSVDQGIQLRDQWHDGKMEVQYSSWIAIYPQMLNPTPPQVADVNFRRAMLQAIDRQQIVDTIMSGVVPVADSYLSPKDVDEATYRQIDQRLVKYPYDTRRSLELLDGLGYTKGADGVLQNGAGQKLEVEIRTTGGDDLQEKTHLSVTDYWRRLGVNVDPVAIPPQRARDREYRANFPAFEEVRQPNDLSPSALTRLHGSEAALPENNYTGNNRMRYRNAEFDALIDRFYITIPKAERYQVLADILHHATEQVTPLPLFYNAQPSMISNRLANVGTGALIATEAWNAWEWDTK
jgi:peptide/nickel transport system substrate-binding protein